MMCTFRSCGRVKVDSHHGQVWPDASDELSAWPFRFPRLEGETWEGLEDVNAEVGCLLRSFGPGATSFKPGLGVWLTAWPPLGDGGYQAVSSWMEARDKLVLEEANEDWVPRLEEDAELDAAVEGWLATVEVEEGLPLVLTGRKCQ